MLKDILLDTAANKILNFLTLHKGGSFYDKEVSERTELSRGITNTILNQFYENGLVTRERRGRMWFYSLSDNPLFKHFRIYENLVELSDLTNDLKSVSKRIILFGSTANGIDTSESDIDLFILTEEKDKVSQQIRKFESKREIKPVIQSALEYATSRKVDKAFYEEVAKGIVLFEKETDEQRL